MCARGDPGSAPRGDPQPGPPPHRATARGPAGCGSPRCPPHHGTAWRTGRSGPRMPRVPATPPLDSPWSGLRPAAWTRLVPTALPGGHACCGPPSSPLRLRCARGLPWRESLRQRVAREGPHPCIRLCDTGGAHSARLTGEAPLQRCAASGCATSHAALLAPVVPGSPGAVGAAGVPQATHPQSWGAVVCVAYSSRTLPNSWQLCRKCTLADPGEYLPPSRSGCVVCRGGATPLRRPGISVSLCRRLCATTARRSAHDLSTPEQPCCTQEEGRPLRTAWQEEVLNHLTRRGSRARVVSGEETARRDRVRCGSRRRAQANH